MSTSPTPDGIPAVIRIDRPVLCIGRSAGADTRIPHPGVSRRHAELSRVGGAIVVRDVGSRAGILVNGLAVSTATVGEDDLVAFGPVVYEVKGNHLRLRNDTQGVEVVARDLEYRYGGEPIVSGVNLTIPPNNFVGILGPSGAGKTTLLKGLAGFLPAAAGRVAFDGLDLAEHPDVCRAMAGFVPQDDVVFRSLTARENLNFALRLRVAGDLRWDERRLWVKAALDRLDLAKIADDPFVGRLSGGQRKRVSVAVELLSRPRLLFLDEPTAGLDPAVEARFMMFLHELSRRGTTVICTTHVLESLHQFDAVMVVAAGRLVGMGSSGGLLDHFGAKTYAQLYEALEKLPPAAPVAKAVPMPAPKAASPLPARIGPLSEILTLVHRNSVLLLRDRTLVLFLFGQPVVIGILIALSQVFPNSINLLLTLVVVAIIWLGLNNTAREVVRDRAYYGRERRGTLRPESYLTAKVVLLGGVGLVQLLLLVSFLRFAYPALYPTHNYPALTATRISDDDQKHLSGLSVPMSVLVLWLTYLAAMLLGLAISTLSPTEEVAVAVLPLVVLPQLLLTGAAAGVLTEPGGWFRPLVHVVESVQDTDRGIGGWCLEIGSLFTYSRPASVFFLNYRTGLETRSTPGVVAAVNWAHLLFLVLATATALLGVFRWRERRWLESA